MADYVPGLLENSAKMLLLFHLIEESVRKGDKMLVFSQSLSTLTVIEDFLAKRPVPPSSKYSGSEGTNQNWVRNINYYRLDGSTTASERERLINQFNEPSNTSAWVFLLSTRAGCLGVNLIGANRVVVFDASWNPCHDAQAVCRVYRYGQRKPCHIYRLVCDYTLERKIYDRQVSKQSMSDRVVDDLNPVLNFTRREVESLLHFVGEEPEPARLQLQPRDAMEDVLRKVLHIYPHLITKGDEAERGGEEAARKGYEEEKRSSVPYTRPSYATTTRPGQSLANIPAFSQRNWRPPPRMEEKPVANVQTVQSTPTPIMPCQAPADTTASDPSEGSLGGFPINYLHKAGVLVQKIVTTTGTLFLAETLCAPVYPNLWSTRVLQVTLSFLEPTALQTSRLGSVPGEHSRDQRHQRCVHPYQRWSHLCHQGCQQDQGALKTSLHPKMPESHQRKYRTMAVMWKSPPVSPDGQDIISELQRYAVGPRLRANEPAVGTTGPQEMAPDSALSASTNLASAKEAKTNDNNGVIATTKVSMLNHHSNASLANAQPSMDASTGQDLETSSKRKTQPPPLDKRASQLPVPGEHSSASLAPQGFPVSGGYGGPSTKPHPAMLSGSWATRSSWDKLPLSPSLLSASPRTNGGTCMMYPGEVWSGSARDSAVFLCLSTPCSDSVFCARRHRQLSSSPSAEMDTSRSLASPLPRAVHPDGLPGSAATPARRIQLPLQVPSRQRLKLFLIFPVPLLSLRSFSSRRGTVLVKNGGNLSATGSSEDDDDNDVIEVMDSDMCHVTSVFKHCAVDLKPLGDRDFLYAFSKASRGWQLKLLLHEENDSCSSGSVN
ncbi:unnamed protein product [Boreogadus saida]